MNREVDADLLSRFAEGLDRLVPQGERFGVAVSGGPDSLGLLLLCAAARPGEVEAATVDHALRPESRSEAESVEKICAEIDVPHTVLTAEWRETPKTAVQERARAERYRLLVRWAKERGLASLLTAHHSEDQAETLLMRLVRGAGVRGLAGMRAVRRIGDVKLVRPLLNWSRADLAKLCADAEVEPLHDPSNENEQFERVRVRTAIAETDWLDPKALARSAANLRAADAALSWASGVEWRRGVRRNGRALVYAPVAPLEIRRRVAARAVTALASEGKAEALRGREIDRLLAALATGRKATLRGVLCTGGKNWRFEPAPKRRGVQAEAAAKG